MSKAGKSTRKMAQERRRNTNLILLGALILTIIGAIILQNWRTLGLSGGAFLALLILLRILPDLLDKPIRRREKAERRADRGAAAEELVGDLLEELSDDFFVLNDIPSPYGNIDHIVIGKNHGIFLLETKAHGGKVQFLEDNILINHNPPEKDFIAQTLKNTYWLRDEILEVTSAKVWIIPVIVFTNAFVPAGKPIKGVHVLNKRFLLEFLQRQSSPNPNLNIVWESREQLARCLED